LIRRVDEAAARISKKAKPIFVISPRVIIRPQERNIFRERVLAARIPYTLIKRVQRGLSCIMQLNLVRESARPACAPGQQAAQASPFPVRTRETVALFSPPEDSPPPSPREIAFRSSGAYCDAMANTACGRTRRTRAVGIGAIRFARLHQPRMPSFPPEAGISRVAEQSARGIRISPFAARNEDARSQSALCIGRTANEADSLRLAADARVISLKVSSLWDNC